MNAGRHVGSLTKHKRLRWFEIEALKTGVSPLEFVISVMQDPNQPIGLRCEMAGLALPYCHARVAPLAPVDDEPRPTSQTTTINIVAIPAGITLDPEGNLPDGRNISTLAAPVIEAEPVDREEFKR